MNFCNLCGGQINNETNTCPKCGASFVIQNIQAAEPEITADSLLKKPALSFFKKNVILFLLTIVLFISIPFLMQADAINIDVGVYVHLSDNFSINEALIGNTNAEFPSYFLFFMITSMLIIFLPLVFNRNYRAIYFLPAKIWSILNFIMCLAILIMHSTYDTQSGIYPFIMFKLTSSGRMFIISNLTLIVLIFILSHKAKKTKKICKKA